MKRKTVTNLYDELLKIIANLVIMVLSFWWPLSSSASFMIIWSHLECKPREVQSFVYLDQHVPPETTFWNRRQAEMSAEWMNEWMNESTNQSSTYMSTTLDGPMLRGREQNLLMCQCRIGHTGGTQCWWTVKLINWFLLNAGWWVWILEAQGNLPSWNCHWKDQHSNSCPRR